MSKKSLFSFLATLAGGALGFGLHYVGAAAPIAVPVATAAASGIAHWLGHVLGADVKVSE